jgi:hypothetical protein
LFGALVFFPFNLDLSVQLGLIFDIPIELGFVIIEVLDGIKYVFGKLQSNSFFLFLGEHLYFVKQVLV